jgi:ABC-2 type transport system permease protein
MFYGTADMFFDAFLPMGLSWLAFAFIGIAAIGFGVLGTVFLANSMVYNAKDNDLLLSMPIKPRDIIFSRVFTLYIMNLFYESMIILPCFAAYIVRGNISFGVILGAVAVLFVLPLISLAISLVLGFLVALTSGRVKSKSLVTVVVSIAFIVVYFYVVMQMQNYMTMLIANGEAIGNNIKSFVYPIYALGLACTGDMLHLLVFILFAAALFIPIYFVMCMRFLELATIKKGGKKAVYREKTYKNRGGDLALLGKELSHIWASPIYLMNSSAGSLILIVGAVALIVKLNDVLAILESLPMLSGILPLIVGAAILSISSMNFVTAPSISLEGKNIWLLRSLPVSAWSVLKSKLSLHMIVNGVPTLIFALVCAVCLPMDIASRVLLPVLAIVLNLMFAAIGLASNLKRPSFDWTNEAVPVKQGMSVLFAMLAGMGITMFFVIAYFVLTLGLSLSVPAPAFLFAVLLICSALAALVLLWLYKRGTKIFETF